MMQRFSPILYVLLEKYVDGMVLENLEVAYSWLFMMYFMLLVGSFLWSFGNSMFHLCNMFYQIFMIFIFGDSNDQMSNVIELELERFRFFFCKMFFKENSRDFRECYNNRIEFKRL